MTPVKKLSKDQIQKIFLTLIGFCFLVYVYFTFFLGPLNRSRANMEQRMADLQAKLGSSQSELRKVTSLERAASTATARYDALQQLTPEGAPIAWFPPRIKAFFADEKIDKAVAHLGSYVDPKEPELAGWSKYSWLISLPEAEYAALGKAIADLENSEPLLWIERLTIHAQAEQLQFQQVDIIADHIIKKK
jgi:hypothetical protein